MSCPNPSDWDTWWHPYKHMLWSRFPCKAPAGIDRHVQRDDKLLAVWLTTTTSLSLSRSRKLTCKPVTHSVFRCERQDAGSSLWARHEQACFFGSSPGSLLPWMAHEQHWETERGLSASCALAHFLIMLPAFRHHEEGREVYRKRTCCSLGHSRRFPRSVMERGGELKSVGLTLDCVFVVMETAVSIIDYQLSWNLVVQIHVYL